MAPAAHAPHVLIIGAGIGGLFLAQFLRKNGIEFEIFDRDASPSARTAGWAIGLNLLDDYTNYLPDDLPPVRSTCHLLPLDLPSQFIHYPPGGMRVGVEDTPETPCVRANRGKLRQLLLTEVDVQWGKHAVRVEEDKTTKKVTVHFKDGTSAVGDLLIGADGTFSNVRESVLGRSNSDVLQPVPMAMIYGEVTLSGQAFENQLRLGNSSYIAIHPGTIFFSGLDKVSADGGSGSFYWFIYMRDDDAGKPDHWLRTATREAKYQHVLERTAGILHPKFTEIARLGGPESIGEPFVLYYDAIIKDLPTGSRVLLIGDAAHPTTPFRGEGGIAAIKDALQLSQLLAKADASDEAALQASLDSFQKEVTERGSVVVQMSRDAVLGSGPARTGKPRSWGYEVRPIPERTESLGLGGVATSA